MGASEELAEVARLAARADAAARSAAWQDPAMIQAAIATVASAITEQSAPAPEAARPITAALADGVPVPAGPVAGPHSGMAIGVPTSTTTSARQEGDLESSASLAVAEARITLLRAYRAVLLARLDELGGNDVEASRSLLGGLTALGRDTAAHSATLLRAAWGEFVHVWRDRPRDVAVRLGISFGLGLAYLGFLRLFRWDTTEPELPYIALFALSGVVGGAVGTNALSVDANRVRQMLTGGTKLWLVMVAKNLALLVVVGIAGMILSALVIIRTDDGTAFVKAIGQLFAMIFIWLGVGNVLSVLSPLRAEPISERRHDGTLKAYGVALLVSFGLGYLVNLMLYWRVWAKTTLIERLGGVWIPVTLIIFSAIGMWLLLTVLATSLAQNPAVRRRMLRELVDYRHARAARKAVRQ